MSENYYWTDKEGIGNKGNSIVYEIDVDSSDVSTQDLYAHFPNTVITNPFKNEIISGDAVVELIREANKSLYQLHFTDIVWKDYKVTGKLHYPGNTTIFEIQGANIEDSCNCNTLYGQKFFTQGKPIDSSMFEGCIITKDNQVVTSPAPIINFYEGFAEFGWQPEEPGDYVITLSFIGDKKITLNLTALSGVQIFNWQDSKRENYRIFPDYIGWKINSNPYPEPLYIEEGYVKINFTNANIDEEADTRQNRRTTISIDNSEYVDDLKIEEVGGLQRVSFKPKDLEGYHSYIITLKDDITGKTITLKLQQIYSKATVVPSFDYINMSLKYEDGRDLEIIGGFTNIPELIQVGTFGYDFFQKYTTRITETGQIVPSVVKGIISTYGFLGFGGTNRYDELGNYTRPNTIYGSVERSYVYGAWTQDATTIASENAPGYEALYLNFSENGLMNNSTDNESNITVRDYIGKNYGGVIEFKLYGYWREYEDTTGTIKGTKDVTLSYTLYKGGTMELNYLDDEDHTKGAIYKNIGGSIVDEIVTKIPAPTASGTFNLVDPNLICTITYSVYTGIATIDINK